MLLVPCGEDIVQAIGVVFFLEEFFGCIKGQILPVLLNDKIKFPCGQKQDRAVHGLHFDVVDFIRGWIQ